MRGGCENSWGGRELLFFIQCLGGSLVEKDCTFL